MLNILGTNLRPSYGRTSVAAGVLALFFWLFASAAFAQQEAAPQQYDVELIIFRHLGAQASPEDWALEERIASRGKLSVSEESADRIAANPDSLAVQPLKPEEFKLTALAASLRASRNYRLLSHIAWTQTAVALRGGLATALAPMLDPASPVSGAAKFSRGTNLHLSVDLRLTDTSGGPAYVLQTTRQIRLGEKHYFDHPHFGVIATVTARGSKQ